MINKYYLEETSSSDSSHILNLISKIEPSLKIKEDIIKTILDDANNHIFLIKFDDKNIGIVTLTLEPKFIHEGCKAGHVEDLLILPEYRGNKISNKVIEELKEKCMNSECYKIILDVSNSKIKDIFKNSGFQEDGHCMSYDYSKSK